MSEINRFAMIVYSSTKKGFISDVETNNIEDILQDNLLAVMKKNVTRSEYISWQNSLKEMFFVLNKSEVPDDAGISIEFNIPWSGKRVDFIVSGIDGSGKESVVIIELKQWGSVEPTQKDAVVIARYENWPRETSHPSYQAWSYARLLEWFNKVVYENGMRLEPCAYLHNYKSDGVIDGELYRHWVDLAPAFLKGEREKLAAFIAGHVRLGDSSDIMGRIDRSEMRPSKALADSMASMLKGNREFVMIDEQKLVYETALDIAKKSSASAKKVLVVEGWPGTGKSVVAVNLLVEMGNRWLSAQYVTKNSAPRAVYQSKLSGTLRHGEISNLFVGSGSYVNCPKNKFDALIVDEAHRLNEKSWMFANLGENQVKEIIESSKFSVFFVDEDQKVTFKDIGQKEEIEKWAKALGAEIEYMELSSQFRCNGSDGYLAWLDDVLQIRDTANAVLDPDDYDFRIVDSPNQLRDLIFEKNRINNKARLVAGYCWDWDSRKNRDANDIVIPEHDFGMKWNLAIDGNLWILGKESVNEVWCIHTCQWLEVDYVGVIVWPDMVVRNGEVLVDPSKRAKTDASLKGYKTLAKSDPEGVKDRVRGIIKNTYRTLMTRGMKWCYVYFCDEETRRYFEERLIRGSGE